MLHYRWALPKSAILLLLEHLLQYQRSLARWKLLFSHLPQMLSALVALDSVAVSVSVSGVASKMEASVLSSLKSVERFSCFRFCCSVSRLCSCNGSSFDLSQTSLLLLLQHSLLCISIYREFLELLLLQPVAVPAVATNVTALAISATGVLPVLDILPTSNADTTPVT